MLSRLVWLPVLACFPLALVCCGPGMANPTSIKCYPSPCKIEEVRVDGKIIRPILGEYDIPSGDREIKIRVNSIWVTRRTKVPGGEMYSGVWYKEGRISITN